MMRATLQYLAKKTGWWKLSSGDSIRQELALSDKVFIISNMNDKI
jgi:hypothetical protein